MIGWSSYVMSTIMFVNSFNVHYYERYVNLEIRGTRPSLPQIAAVEIRPHTAFQQTVADKPATLTR
jgi:hypothetical protein